MEDERVAADEFLRRLAGGEDAHRTASRVVEGPDHEQLTAVGELPPPGPVRREVLAGLGRHVVGRLVEHHGLQCCPPIVAAGQPRIRALPSRYVLILPPGLGREYPGSWPLGAAAGRGRAGGLAALGTAVAGPDLALTGK